MSTNSSIVNILFRYYRQELLTEMEIAQLQNWLAKSANHQKLFDDLSNTLEWERNLPVATERDMDPTWEKIQARIAEHGKVAKESIAPAWWRYAAAIGGLMLILGAGWFIWRGDRKASLVPMAQNTKPGQEILPASNNIRLVLDNGRQLLLDSSEKYIIDQKETIARQSPGELTYLLSKVMANKGLNRLMVPIGRQFQVLLSDGTKIWLNAASTLTYPVQFTGSTRKVELNGEAYFEVKADKQHPFQVHTSRGLIEVTGTSFVVADYTDEPWMRTMLINGKVGVHFDKQIATLEPGMAVRVAPEAGIQPVQIPVAQALAWKNQSFWFENATFNDIFRELARWYDITVSFEVPVMARFSGILPRDRPLSQLLTILEKGGKAHFELQGRNVIVKQ